MVLMRLTSSIRNLGTEVACGIIPHDMPRPSPRLTNGSAIPWPSCDARGGERVAAKDEGNVRRCPCQSQQQGQQPYPSASRCEEAIPFAAISQ